MSLSEFLGCFDFETKVVICDKKSREVLYQGCVADVPLSVCNQRELMPDVKEYEGKLNLNVY